jgi:hypothetical protein
MASPSPGSAEGRTGGKGNVKAVELTPKTLWLFATVTHVSHGMSLERISARSSACPATGPAAYCCIDGKAITGLRCVFHYLIDSRTQLQMDTMQSSDRHDSHILLREALPALFSSCSSYM